MKILYSILVMALLVTAILPAVLATSVGTGIGIDITTEDFAPRVWMCDNRLVMDDAVQWGRISPDGTLLVERLENYAFEGEQIAWTVLVMDKNKIDQNIDDYATNGDSQGEGNDIEVNCQRIAQQPRVIPASCNARILEEQLTWNAETMAMFQCILTVETADSMYGEYWITVEAQDADGLMGTMDENEYWFLNPVIALSVDGDLVFEDVRPGTSSYSDTLLVGNDADDGSGVILDMFISGTDFYDSSSSGARCEGTNSLLLKNFRYFATNGAYSSIQDTRAKDVENYVGIGYGDHWDRTMYGVNEIINTAGVFYSPGNILTPGAEVAITFKLNLPEPCNGDFDTGSLYFWGEAI